MRFGECGYAIGILPLTESSFLFGVCGVKSESMLVRVLRCKAVG